MTWTPGATKGSSAAAIVRPDEKCSLAQSSGEAGAKNPWYAATYAAQRPNCRGRRSEARATATGVGDRVIALTSKAQQLLCAAGTFDAVLSINSFEMIGDERPAALAEMVRVARPGARIGIAEPMCLPAAIPAEIAELDERGDLRFQQCFRTVAWNEALFERCGLSVVRGYYFPEARRWWLAYEAQAAQPGREIERELILRDNGRWLSLGQMSGKGEGVRR